MDELIEKALLARKAWYELSRAPDSLRRKALESMSQALVENKEKIIEANLLDVNKFKEEKHDDPLLDRLILNEKRLKSAAEGLKKVSQLPDPIGEVVEGWTTVHGLRIQKVRVPIGVIGVVYESRPNVTIDLSGLAIKSGNAVILRGGSEALNSNKAIVDVLRESIKDILDPNVIQFIENTDRSIVDKMLKLNGYLDLLIPRGSASFIDYVRRNATVPVIETGAGNNHIFVNYDADLSMATNIIINAKVQRPAVCNAVRKVLIHKDIAEKYIPILINELKKYGVTIKGDEKVRAIAHGVILAKDEDWDEEYMDLTLAIKIVNSVEEAVEHINKHGTKHSEAIITNNLNDAHYFTWNVDAACTYVNASIRFTDGEQFGFGAEVGISTQKLHARGPMGIKELTTTKYIIFGEGQTREI